MGETGPASWDFGSLVMSALEQVTTPTARPPFGGAGNKGGRSEATSSSAVSL
jgi:hypothetical protein